jgi:putative transposase
MLHGPIGKEVQKCVMVFCQQLGCEIVEMNVQVDHVHLLVKVPPKLSISELMGVLKGRTAIRMFTQFPTLRKKPYWGESFLGQGVLCRYGWAERRHDSKIRAVSREGGVASAAA